MYVHRHIYFYFTVADAGHRGEWLTQSTAITVNRQSGIAHAVHAGMAVVKYNVSMDSITQTDVRLQSIYF